MGRLDNKIVIVTGAGRGIGRAIAEKLAFEGATVVVTDINGPSARDTAQAIGGSAIAMHADVTSRDSVRTVAEQVKSRFGRIDVLVNNAALFAALPPVPYDQIGLELWDRVMRVNLAVQMRAWPASCACSARSMTGRRSARYLRTGLPSCSSAHRLCPSSARAST